MNARDLASDPILKKLKQERPMRDAQERVNALKNEVEIKFQPRTPAQKLAQDPILQRLKESRPERDARRDKVTRTVGPFVSAIEEPETPKRDAQTGGQKVDIPHVTTPVDALIQNPTFPERKASGLDIQSTPAQESMATVDTSRLPRRFRPDAAAQESTAVEQTVMPEQPEQKDRGIFPIPQYPGINEATVRKLSEAPERGFKRNLPLAAQNVVRMGSVMSPGKIQTDETQQERLGGPILSGPYGMPNVTVDSPPESYVQAADAMKERIMQIPVPEADPEFARAPEKFSEWLQPERIWNAFWENAPLTGTLALTSMANPAIGAALMFAVEGGGSKEAIDEYEKRTGNELSPGQKTAIPIAVGAVNAALEKTGIDTILGRIPASRFARNALVKGMVSAATEGTTEGMQEVVSVLGELGYDENAAQEAGQRMLQAFYGGLVTGGVLGGVIPSQQDTVPPESPGGEGGEGVQAQQPVQAEPETAPTVDAGLDDEQRGILEQEVQRLGSLDAVNQQFTGDDAANRYAREVAQKMYGGQVPEIPPTSQQPQQDEVTPPETTTPPTEPEIVPETQPEVPEVMLATGETRKTSSGRTTTPFPKIDTSTNRKAINTNKRVDNWIRSNAIQEAESRGDDWNAKIFRGETIGKDGLPQASRESMNEYLFGQQPEVKRSILKDLGDTKTQETETAEAPETPEAQPEPETIGTFKIIPTGDKKGSVNVVDVEGNTVTKSPVPPKRAREIATKKARGNWQDMDTIKKRGRKYYVMRNDLDELKIRSASNKDDVRPYSYGEWETYQKRRSGGSRAAQKQLQDTVLIHPDAMTPALEAVMHAGNWKGEADVFEGVKVGTSPVGAEPLVRQTDEDMRDKAVWQYREATGRDKQSDEFTNAANLSWDDILEEARNDLDRAQRFGPDEAANMEDLEEQRMRNSGMTDRELEMFVEAEKERLRDEEGKSDKEIREILFGETDEDDYIINTPYDELGGDDSEQVTDEEAQSAAEGVYNDLQATEEERTEAEQFFKDIIASQQEEDAATPPTEESAPPQEQDLSDIETTLPDDTRTFVEGKVRDFGSKEAADRFYSGKDSVSRYGRAVAEHVYSGEDVTRVTDEAKPKAEPAARNIPADRTTAAFDTKDARTGEPIKAGDVVYRLTDTNETVSEDTYQKMIDRPEQGGMFAEQPEQRPVESKPTPKAEQPQPPRDIMDTPYSVQEDAQQDMLAGLQGQEDMFAQPDRQGGTGSGNALSYPAEPMTARIWDVQLLPDPETSEKTNKTEIIRWTENAFGVPIRGKTTHKWKNAGMYYPKQAIVRMQKWGELSVMTHEVAHHLDINVLAKEYGKRWRNELAPKGQKRAITQELASLDYNQKQRRTSEGFAEFIRYYLTTDKAERMAPKFYKVFTEKFLPENPDVADKLAHLKDMLEVWRTQGAENRVLAQIDFKGEHTETKGIKRKAKNAWRWLMRHFDNEFYDVEQVAKEIEKATGKKLRPTESPTAMMTYSKAKSGAIARTFVLDKAIDEYGNVVGKGLEEILAPIPNDEMKSFIAYAVARRAETLEARGVETGMEKKDIQYLLDTYQSDMWDAVIDDITEWSNHLLDWVVRAGGLGEEEAAYMRELNPVYVPFKRAFLDELGVFKGTGGMVNRGEAVKRIKGSGRPIVNPIESLITQAAEMINKAQKIRIASKWADLAESENIGGFITKVPPPTRVQSLRLSEIKDFEAVLQELGLLGEGEIADLDMDKMLTAFTQGGMPSGKDNIVSIWRNGKREYYELHPDLYQSLMGIDQYRLPPMINFIFGKPARMLRAGATGIKVSFGLVRNPFRDAFTYAVFSKNKWATPLDPIMGLYKEFTAKDDSPVARFKRSGGALSGMIGFDRAATMRTYDEMMLEKAGALGKTLKVVRHPINTLRDILSITELAPRSQEIDTRYKYYRENRPEWTEEDAYVAAFNDAQDVTINFTRSGITGKKINQVTAFFNVAIQSPDKLLRAVKENPVQFVTKGIAYLTLFALANYWRNKDRQWYKNLPPAYKYGNFWFEMEDDTIVRLPIPFDLGVLFSSSVMSGLDYAKSGDTDYLEGLAKQVEAQIPEITPSLIGPMWDVGRNKNYLDRPIESMGMQFMPVTERKSDYTTKLASALSKGFNALNIELSPIQIDYLLDAYTGGFRRQLPGKEITEPADIPVLGDILLRMPENPRRQLDAFFWDYETIGMKIKADDATPAEKRRYLVLKPVYREMRHGFRRLKKLRKDEDTEGIRRVYDIMRKRLEKAGYK